MTAEKSRVLIIDDDAAHAEVIAEGIERVGCDPVTATSGEEGLAALDREEFDFSLEVSSAGATAPLDLPRQYHKHLGRILEVKTEALEVKGTLESVGAHEIVLSWKAREPKPIGKGKHTGQPDSGRAPVLSRLQGYLRGSARPE